MKKHDEDYYKDRGYGYQSFDWKEIDSFMRCLGDLTCDSPLCFRLIDAGDDSYHFVYASEPVSTENAKHYLLFYSGDPAFWAEVFGVEL